MAYPQPHEYPVVPVRTQVVLQSYRCSTGHVVIAWILTLLTGGYLLPWAIAATRNRRNVAAVALVDLFLGWTLIGWFVALVMACGSDRPVVLVHHTYAHQPVWSPPPPAPLAPAPYPPGRAATPELAVEHTMIDPLSTEPTVWLPDARRSTDRR